jgi:hypothetical protein
MAKVRIIFDLHTYVYCFELILLSVWIFYLIGNFFFTVVGFTEESSVQSLHCHGQSVEAIR